MEEDDRKPFDVQNRDRTHHVQIAGRHFSVDMDDHSGNKSNGPRPETRIEDTELYQLLKPFLACMQIFGSFFRNYEANNVDGSSTPSNRTRWIRRQRLQPVSCLEEFWRIFSRHGRAWSLFSIIILLVALVTVIGFVLVLIAEFTLEMIFFAIFLVCVMLLGLVGSFVYYRLNTTGKMLLLFQKYSDLQMSPFDKRIMGRQIGKACVLITGINITAIIFIVIGWSHLLNTSYNEKTETLLLYMILDKFPFPINKFLFYLLFLSGFMFINAFCLQSAFIVLISVVLFIILKQFNDALEKNQPNDHGDDEDHLEPWTERSIETMHLKFQKIVDMIDVFDNAIGLYIIPFVVLMTSSLCLIIYFMLFYCTDDFTRCVFISWILLLVSMGMSVLLSAAIMNSMAMRSNRALREMDISNLTSKSVIKFLLLMNSVNRPIGITSMGYFTITKSYIISLTTTICSYFFVLIEFSPSSSMCEETTATVKLQ